MNFDSIKVEIPASGNKHYPIIIGSGLLAEIGSILKSHLKADKILIVTNETVNRLYGKTVEESLDNAGFTTNFIVLEDGEQYKKLNSLERIWDSGLSFKLERKDAILALGGGVIGDIAGFAASSFLRGIDFVQVPTTLLAQVDSSVGGKVAINCHHGKNLIGAFYQPQIVITDINTLETLPEEQLKTGLAEVIKYAFIEKSCGAKEFLETSLIDFLRKNKEEVFALNPEIIKKLIKYCCILKAAVVNQDEKEAGLRAILNFGHTIGHAIEKCTDYEKFTHGQAVAMGMIGAIDIAKNMNLISDEYNLLALDLIWQYNLNYHIPQNASIEELQASMLLDKKVMAKKIRFVLPVDTGKVDIFSNIDEKLIKSALEKLY